MPILVFVGYSLTLKKTESKFNSFFILNSVKSYIFIFVKLYPVHIQNLLIYELNNLLTVLPKFTILKKKYATIYVQAHGMKNIYIVNE